MKTESNPRWSAPVANTSRNCSPSCPTTETDLKGWRSRNLMCRFAQCLLCLALLLSPVGVLGGPLVQRFFPLCNGDTKSFFGTLTCTPGTVNVTMTVTATTYNGQSAFDMRLQATGGTGTTDQHKYFRIVGDDVLYLGATFSGGGSSLAATFNPPIRILNESGLASGGVCAGNTAAAVSGNAIPPGNYPVQYSYTIGFGGSFTVPACAYSDSRTVAGSFTITDPTDPDVTQDFPEFLYLAPDVGIARIRIYAVNQFGVFITCGWAELTGGQVCGHPVCAGTLCVALQPPEAVAAGAMWRRMGTTLWRTNGECEPGLATGQITVEFKPVAGWNTPVSQTVNIVNGQTTQVTATYTRTGSLQVVITAIEKLGNDIRLSFTGGLGNHYVLQSRTNISSGTWTALPGITTGNAGIAQTTVTNALNQPRQFYRIQQVP